MTSKKHPPKHAAYHRDQDQCRSHTLTLQCTQARAVHPPMDNGAWGHQWVHAHHGDNRQLFECNSPVTQNRMQKKGCLDATLLTGKMTGAAAMHG